MAEFISGKTLVEIRVFSAAVSSEYSALRSSLINDRKARKNSVLVGNPV